MAVDMVLASGSCVLLLMFCLTNAVVQEIFLTMLR